MKRTTKRIVSLTLCLMMLLALLPASVFAADPFLVQIIPDNPTVTEGDTATFTVIATGGSISSLQFELKIPKGMTYVANSAKIPSDLKTKLGWAAIDWTESSMFWSGYNNTVADFSEGVVLMTFSCVMDQAGTFKIDTKDLMCFDGSFQQTTSQLEAEPINVRAKDPEVPSFFYTQVTPSVSNATVGDTINYTITAVAVDVTALEFTLEIPEGMTYVPGSAKIPEGLCEDLEWEELDWTEETMKWTGYNHIGVTFDEGTVLMTFSCVVNKPGSYQVTMKDLIPVDGDFIRLEAITNFDYLNVTGNVNIQIPTLTPRFPTVSFEDMIVMNIYFEATDIEDVVEMGMLTFNGQVTSADISIAKDVVPGCTWNESAKMYVSSTNGIAAKELGDKLYFAVYAKLADGTYTYSKVIGYSVETYVKKQLETGNAAMKALMVATLNYGAAAQKQFNYNTSNLINASLTDAQKALNVAYSDDIITAAEKPTGTKLGEMVKTGAFTRFYPTVSFEGAFSINYYFVPATAPVGDITMYVWTQADYNATASLSKANASYTITMELLESGEYRAIVENIAAKQLNDAVYVSICYNTGSSNYCSGITGYSIGLYCKANASKTTTMGELARATAIYGHYAKLRFG